MASRCFAVARECLRGTVTENRRVEARGCYARAIIPTCSD
jgi:hypothetical protein